MGQKQPHKMTLITRQAYCERCAKAGRPYRDLQFIVCGENGFHLRTIEKYIPKDLRGFTPHLVSPYKLIGEKDIAISRVCCIVGCGLDIKPDPTDRNKIIFTYKAVSYDQLSLVDYNALVKNKDFGYKI